MNQKYVLFCFWHSVLAFMECYGKEQFAAIFLQRKIDI